MQPNIEPPIIEDHKKIDFYLFENINFNNTSQKLCQVSDNTFLFHKRMHFPFLLVNVSFQYDNFHSNVLFQLFDRSWFIDIHKFVTKYQNSLK